MLKKLNTKNILILLSLSLFSHSLLALNNCKIQDFENLRGPHNAPGNILYNIQACDLADQSANSDSNSSNDIATITSSTSEIIFGEDDHLTEFSKKSQFCGAKVNNGFCSVLTNTCTYSPSIPGLGAPVSCSKDEDCWGDNLCNSLFGSGSKCHGADSLGTCLVSTNTCSNNPSLSCSIDAHCTNEENYFCYQPTGRSSDFDGNDYKLSYETACSEGQTFLETNNNVRFLAGGTLYTRALAAGGMNYRDADLSFRMPCYGKVWYLSYSSFDVNQIRNYSTTSIDDLGGVLKSSGRTLRRGELISLNKFDSVDSKNLSWPNNFCGKNHEDWEINQTTLSQAAGYYSGVMFQCELDEYNGPISETLPGDNPTSACNYQDWISFNDGDWENDPQNSTQIDSYFYRPSNPSTLMRFPRDWFDHLMQDTDAGINLERQDLGEYFPEFMNNSSGTSLATGWDSALASCDEGGCKTSSNYIFATNPSDGFYVLHELNPSSPSFDTNHHHTTHSARPSNRSFMRGPEEVLNSVESFPFRNGLEADVDYFVNNLEIMSVDFNDDYVGCNPALGSCPNQEFGDCNATTSAADLCEQVASLEVSSDSVACCNGGSHDNTCRASSVCISGGGSPSLCSPGSENYPCPTDIPITPFVAQPQANFSGTSPTAHPLACPNLLIDYEFRLSQSDFPSGSAYGDGVTSKENMYAYIVTQHNLPGSSSVGLNCASTPDLTRNYYVTNQYLHLEDPDNNGYYNFSSSSLSSITFDSSDSVTWTSSSGYTMISSSATTTFFICGWTYLCDRTDIPTALLPQSCEVYSTVIEQGALCFHEFPDPGIGDEEGPLGGL